MISFKPYCDGKYEICPCFGDRRKCIKDGCVFFEEYKKFMNRIIEIAEKEISE